MSLELEYRRACDEAVRECLALGYVPTAWMGMLERYGAVDAAKRLLANGDIQPGLLRLLRLNRVDLTVEQSVLEPRWQGIFDDRDRASAAWRLARAQIEG